MRRVSRITCCITSNMVLYPLGSRLPKEKLLPGFNKGVPVPACPPGLALMLQVAWGNQS